MDGAQEQREYYQEKVSEINRNDLIFLDEFGCELNMTKTHGRSLKGYPVYEEKRTHSSKRLNTIAVLSEKGFETKFSYGVSLDSAIFIYFLEYFILPKYKEKTIVMDRHPVHYSKEVKKFMNDNEIKYLYLPPYSPELNPIEEAFSKAKGFIKKKKPRTLECLRYIVNKAMETITKTDAENYIEHAAEFSLV